MTESSLDTAIRIEAAYDRQHSCETNFAHDASRQAQADLL